MLSAVKYDVQFLQIYCRCRDQWLQPARSPRSPIMAFIPITAADASRRAHGRPIAACSSISASERTGDRTRSTVSRRSVLQRAVALCASATVLDASAATEAETVTETNILQEFTEYRGPLSLGFSFQYPIDWNVKKKPIKTHLSEVIVTSKQVANTSAGLVVDMVKINSIESFGSPDDVGQKVVDLELKKDSVSNAQLLSSKAEKKDGLTYYIVDYTVESSRGAKRYMAKATITGQQLFVFTAQSKMDDFKGDTRTTLERMVESFSVKPQYT